LYYHLKAGFEYMAQGNYPYSSKFVNDLPGHPVDVSCKAFEELDEW